MEIEANQFASNLVMPSWMLKVSVERQPFDVEESAEALAKEYRVSVQAMSLRLARFLKYNL